MKNRLNLCLAVLSALTGFLIAEIGFRVHLHRLVGSSERSHVDFDVLSTSYCEYDKAFGFHYKPNLSADWCSIRDSLPILTGTVSFDRRGNSGPDVAGPDPELRIALLGDSFSVIQHDGVPWPYLLQQQLRESTGRNVEVVNFARDGYGILQMMDLAAAVADEKPDAILIAFITPDLVRARFWRMEVETPGGVDLMTSITPTLHIDKPETFTRTALINPLVTRSWAERLIAGKDRNDPLLQSLIDTYLRQKKNYSITRFDPFSLRTSYLWQGITNPAIRAGSFYNAEIPYDNLLADGRFLRAVTKLRGSGIPVYLVHLPYHPDLAAGKYVAEGHLRRLLDSLLAVTGFPRVTILPPAPMGRHADIMVISPMNWHPSKHGTNFYALRVAKALRGEEAIWKRGHPAGGNRE